MVGRVFPDWVGWWVGWMPGWGAVWARGGRVDDREGAVSSQPS